MQHTAINATYQRQLNNLYKADRRYCALVDKHQLKLDSIDPDSDRYHDVAMRQEDKECELYEQYREAYVDELPQRELDKFVMSYTAFHGYGPYLV
jgi:hypothetical protein